MLSEREDIAIAEVAVYLPLLCLAVYVCVRHGFIKQLGWLYLVIFCTLRIASGIMGIIYAKHPNSITDAIWAAVLGSVGLSPLFLVGIDLLERGNEFLGDKKKVVLALRLLHLPIILGLILSIVGGTRLSSSDSSKQSEGEKFEKAGGILYLIGYVGLFGIAVLTMARIRNLPSGEKRILLAVLAALPLLAVRLLYSLLADFANNSTFSILGGNATVQLCMAIIEEMIATIIFLAAGITAPSIKNVERGSDHMAMNQKPPPQYVHCTGTVSSTAGLMEGQ